MTGVVRGLPVRLPVVVNNVGGIPAPCGPRIVSRPCCI